jgi:rhodanese-related sulfurtransferase
MKRLALRLPDWIAAATAAATAALGGLAVRLLLGGSSQPAADATDGELALEVSRRYAAIKRLLFPGLPEITVAEWAARPASPPAVLVDVRQSCERRVSMLPGAISRQDFERNRARYRSWVVVPYCTIGLRSGLYTRKLRRQGFAARNLAGSVLAWAHAGLPFESEAKASRRVHVHNADWNLLPRGYEPVVSDSMPLPARS